jgi:hypothetical protein
MIENEDVYLRREKQRIFIFFMVMAPFFFSFWVKEMNNLFEKGVRYRTQIPSRKKTEKIVHHPIVEHCSIIFMFFLGENFAFLKLIRLNSRSFPYKSVRNKSIH